ncbi:Ppx/GppA phosphatase family protein [Pelomonas aquatica]|jgi:exopolyphosphatase/guanosine-5'-triphosphate,3'-diphosphate pyrophosphatase|uniref:Ppx/GppA family phosphatase n=1 Tax=Pelomonas aquatica TaxID=431058 RepID=A0A9X4R4H8_9BURK|nr:Ppx/GppA phosphatase family protein [Pelomonas aquatica]MCY4755603.1 Ppx/GppA phosphatase family protein [Pelomonas aquatica]MDG0862184.1 Ppx/GppA family phosphatase [Pelomonas aquatica]
MTTRRAPSPPIWASIDIGSNSFRLELARMSGERYQRLSYVKESVRLGAGLDAQGMLTEAAMERGLACLKGFGEQLGGIPPRHVRAVATQTLREARNRNAFLARAQAVLGHPVEVISGREEARLIFAGVARLQPSARPRLVIDIGGRSTEMILGSGRRPLLAESFGVGSVGLSLRFFADGRYTEEAFRAAQVAAGAELEEALTLFRPELWQEALGSSGTVGAVSQILAASGRTDGRITPAALRWCIEQCLAAGSQDGLQLAGLKDDRRPVVAGGLCILYTLLTQFGIAELLPTKGALRQGVIFDLAERLQPSGARDPRAASVAELQARFGVDLAQADRVAAQAERLYRQLAPRPAAELLHELRWAAALHELGMLVSHHDHHRHSAYVIGHVDAAGFSTNQLQRLAALALGQRGGLRKMESQLADSTLLEQLVALRLAVILCHARTAAAADGLKLARAGRQLTLRCPRSWSADQARTRFLLKEESEAWARTGLLDLIVS